IDRPGGVPGAVITGSVDEFQISAAKSWMDLARRTSRTGERTAMKRVEIAAAATVFLATASAFPLNAQEPQEPQPYSVGDALGVRGPDGAFGEISSNVKVYGAIYSAESCSYDA